MNDKLREIREWHESGGMYKQSDINAMWAEIDRLNGELEKANEKPPKKPYESRKLLPCTCKHKPQMYHHSCGEQRGYFLWCQNVKCMKKGPSSVSEIGARRLWNEMIKGDLPAPPQGKDGE